RNLVEELRIASTMLKDELADQAPVALNAAQRAAIHAAAEPKVRRWAGVRVAGWATGLAAAGLILAAALTPSLLRSRQAASEPAALPTAENVPGAATGVQPVYQQPSRMKSQSDPLAGRVAPPAASAETAPELQYKEEKLSSDFAKDDRRERDAIQV